MVEMPSCRASVEKQPEKPDYHLLQLLAAWRENNRVRLYHIQPGKPNQNAYIERFNRTFRTEVLDAHVFNSPSQVRELVHRWMTDYNEERPLQSPRQYPAKALFSTTQPPQTNRPIF